jgi:hypothetical protein
MAWIDHTVTAMTLFPRRCALLLGTVLFVACAPPRDHAAAKANERAATAQATGAASASPAGAGPDAAMAAARFTPAVTWQASSLVTGDFSCRGRLEQAVLGIGGDQIVVAVFTDGLMQAPQLLQFPAAMRDPATSTLVVESLDIDLARLRGEIGIAPPGLRPSKTCKGLNLSDGKVDSAHIYWNHEAARFAAWSL